MLLHFGFAPLLLILLLLLLLFLSSNSAFKQVVHACIYKDPSGGDPLEIVALKELNGVWSVRGPKVWEGCYYEYEVSVYHPSTQRIEKCTVNDPYARGYVGCLRLSLSLPFSENN